MKVTFVCSRCHYSIDLAQ